MTGDRNHRLYGEADKPNLLSKAYWCQFIGHPGNRLTVPKPPSGGQLARVASHMEPLLLIDLFFTILS